MKTNHTHTNPWSWVSTLYFVEGLPYITVMTLSVILYKRLGISNTDIALYTGWLYLPWVIKPFWSPFIDLLKTKRWWIVTMQLILAITFAGIAFAIPTSFFFQLTLAIFWLTAFTSATHDIAADGFYMHALNEHEQSLYVGIRSTFYRIATVAGQGVLVIIAGLIEINSGLSPAKLQVEASSQSIRIQQQCDNRENTNTQHFIYTEILEATKDQEGIQGIIEIAKKNNEKHKFVNVEKTLIKAEQVSSKEGAFTAWLRNTFGEEQNKSKTISNYTVLAGIRLSHPLKEGETEVLNLEFLKGNSDIHLEQNKLSTRFTFTAQNWNKPALFVLSSDAKIKGTVKAVFSGTSGNISLAWFTVFIILSLFFLGMTLYHNWNLPRPVSDHALKGVTIDNILKEFLITFKTFFTKPQALTAILFMLLYRLPEAQLVKLINPFLLDPLDHGGLGLSTSEVGLVYGTVGIIGLTIGGIIGGIVAAHGGLKRWLWPMAISMSLTCITFVYLSYSLNQSLLVINLCVFIEQFGYGFGFTAYMLFLIYFSEGEHKTSHYAICTGFMALGMMLPGMAAGWLQETIGYRHFFVWTMICCAATVIVCSFIKVDSNFGKKIAEK